MNDTTEEIAKNNRSYRAREVMTLGIRRITRLHLGI